jgi:hypothetical protein
MLIILTHGKLRQEDLEFKLAWGYSELQEKSKPFPKTKRTNHNRMTNITFSKKN